MASVTTRTRYNFKRYVLRLSRVHYRCLRHLTCS